MNTSSEFIAELEAADEFVSRLRCLTSGQLATLARRVEDARATTAGDIAWWRATATVSRRLRHMHRSRAAAIAALRASEAVLGAPGAAELPHDAVVHAARAAGDVGRVLLASGPPFALNVFTPGWEDAFRATSAAPTHRRLNRRRPDVDGEPGPGPGHGVTERLAHGAGKPRRIANAGPMACSERHATMRVTPDGPCEPFGECTVATVMPVIVSRGNGIWR
jgi:hypothetical protein